MKPYLYAIIFFCFYASSASARSLPPPLPFKEGSNIYMEQVLAPFPDIGYTNRDGDVVRLSEHKPALKLVNFWATWCAPCIRELPALQELQEKHHDVLEVIAISQDTKGFETIMPFVRDHNLTGIIHGWDKNSREFTKLRMKGLPMSFLIDGKGNLIATIQGETDWLGEDMESVIKTFSN